MNKLQKKQLAAFSLVMMGWSLLVPWIYVMYVYAFANSTFPSYTGPVLLLVISISLIILGFVKYWKYNKEAENDD